MPKMPGGDDGEKKEETAESREEAKEQVFIIVIAIGIAIATITIIVFIIIVTIIALPPSPSSTSSSQMTTEKRAKEQVVTIIINMIMMRRQRSEWPNKEKKNNCLFPFICLYKSLCQERLRQQAIKDKEKERTQFYQKQREEAKVERTKIREKVRSLIIGL